MNAPHTPRIAIVGGGPAGLTLARILQTRGHVSTVFELDRAPDDRPQGGTLDLDVESGQYALRLAGLEREFLAVARYEDQGSRLYDKDGDLRHADDGDGGDRPEVDRTALRGLLLDALEPDTVRWGSKIDSIEPLPDGRFAVDGEPFDLVVGADGAWSRVRPLVSEAKPTYTGVTFYELALDDVDRSHPALSRLVGRGKMFALGEEKAIIAQRNGNAHVRVGAALKIPEGAIHTAVDGKTVESARRDLLRLYAGWSDALLDLFREGDRFRVWPLYVLPVGHAWAHRRGVTLVGDAAHLMTPFSGEGVNLAMLDAAELALALTSEGDWDANVRRFEEGMIERGAREAFGAMHGLESTFSPDGLAGALEWMGQRQPAASEA